MLLAAEPGAPARILAALLGLYGFGLLAMMVLSWFPLHPGRTPARIQRVLLAITDPVVVPLRRALPSMGMIDVSPMIALLTVYFLRDLLLG